MSVRGFTAGAFLLRQTMLINRGYRAATRHQLFIGSIKPGGHFFDLIGWELGGWHCEHLIGKFPHEKIEDHEIDSYIHPDNDRQLNEAGDNNTGCTGYLKFTSLILISK